MVDASRACYPPLVLVRSCEQALAEVGVKRENSARVLVACSGGRDSMALLRVTERLIGARAVVGHVDHGRPGSDAVAVALTEFVRGQGLRIEVVRLEPPRDDEATLRSLRHEALERLRIQVGARCVLLAHTREDQAETVLFRFLRARRREAVTGMNPVSARGTRVRPWLKAPRAEVHAYLAAKGWPHWEDPSNREPRYLRNRLRKELLPLLESRYVAGLARRLAAWADAEAQSCVIVRRVSAESAPLASDTLALFDAAVLNAPRVRSLVSLDWERAGLSPTDRDPKSGLVVCDSDGVAVWIPGVFRDSRSLPTAESRELWAIELGA